MKLLSIDRKMYTLEENGIVFEVKLSHEDGGRIVFDPIMGWDKLCSALNKDAETLYEEIDEWIYNATPEVYEND